MWWKGILAFILLLLATYISFTQFIVREHSGSKFMALILFILSSCTMIAIVIDFFKTRNKKRLSNKSTK